MTKDVKKNKFGLSRDIPNDIALQIRKECGFGCVVCGCAICSYEHIDPPFATATRHDPSCMALLCEHCHSRVTRKFWSKEKIQQARANPWCLKNGRCHDAFDISGDMSLWLGPNLIKNIHTILRIEGRPVLRIEEPEMKGGPYRLSGDFCDKHGKLMLSISRNNWSVISGVWDLKCVGGTITIRSQRHKIAFRCRSLAPQGLAIDRLDMQFGGVRLQIDAKELRVADSTKAGFVLCGRSVEFGSVNSVLFDVVNGRIQMGPGPFKLGFAPRPYPKTFQKLATIRKRRPKRRGR